MLGSNNTQTTGIVYNSLTAGSKIIGTVIADSDFRVDGAIEGDIQCKGKIIIGEKGDIKGTILCQNAEVMGRLDGKIAVQSTLTLRSTANIHGEVKTQTLIVEPNAQFNGTCSMGAEKPAAHPQAETK